MENKPHLKRLYKSFITVLAVVLAMAAFVLYPRGPLWQIMGTKFFPGSDVWEDSIIALEHCNFYDSKQTGHGHNGKCGLHSQNPHDDSSYRGVDGDRL